MDLNQKKLIQATLMDYDRNNDLNAFRMARHFFKMCVNEELTDSSIFRSKIKDIGSWPIFAGEQWDPKNFNWEETIYKLQELNNGGLILDVTLSNDTIYIYGERPGIHPLLLRRGLNNPTVQTYYNLMVFVAKYFGADQKQASTEMKKVLEFEYSFIGVCNETEAEDVLRDKWAIQQIQNEFPFLNWEKFIKTVLGGYKEINKNNKVYIWCKAYIRKIEKSLRETDPRVIANYFFWKTVMNNLEFLSTALRKQYYLFLQSVYGDNTISIPRWFTCLKMITSSNLNFALSAMYAQRNINEKTKNLVTDMTSRIVTKMENTLNSAKWMDKETRNDAIKKVNKMKKLIAYPKTLLNDGLIKKYYANLNISLKETHFECVIKLRKFHLFAYINKQKQPKLTDWLRFRDIFEIDGYYITKSNAIMVPAGVLFYPMFGLHWPMYLNFGFIGNIIGQKVTQEFDMMGKWYDSTGAERNWFGDKTEQEFVKRLQCVIKDANKYTVPLINIALEGERSQHTNVADIGGAKLFLLAYNLCVADHGEELGFGGFTPTKLYWLSVGNSMCTKYDNSTLESRTVSTYPPNEYRVNSIAKNNDLFAEAFNCPVGSNMNPGNKCITC
uniref:Peptidase M13 N-terminal domain-containing protein n=3 Tax=Clastoptera arizonana TaxID=38151 RepID=A0A1B6DLB7_9HEMI